MLVERRIVGAKVLTPDAGLCGAELSLSGGKIVDHVSRAVDLRGYMVLPGIVDIHGDGFERHIAPRRGAMRDLGAGLRALDSELGANGVTTAVLAQFYSWEGGIRGADFAERFVEAHAAQDLRSDTRIQLRLETHMIEDYPRAEALIARAGIGFVVFNDHLPHDALKKGKRPPRLTGQALKSGRSPEAHLALLHALHAHGPDVPEALTALAKRLTDRNVLIASHDDATSETRAAFRAMGACLSEFPETPVAARAARAGGDGIILGAPNVVRGGSHKGKVSATELVAEGLCDALASDYHYPAPAMAAFALAAKDGPVPDMAQAWALVSSGPARLLGLSDRGTLSLGSRADLCVVDPFTGSIEATLSGGVFTHLAGRVAERFLDS